MKNMGRFIIKNKSKVSKIILGIMMFTMILSALPTGVFANELGGDSTGGSVILDNETIEDPEQIPGIEDPTNEEDQVPGDEENQEPEDELENEVDKGKLIVYALEYDGAPSTELIVEGDRIYLADAIFQVENADMVESGVTGNEGKFIFTVPYGEYKVTQLFAPDEYEINKINEINVNVTNEDTNVYFYNTPVESSIEKMDIKVTKDWEGTEPSDVKVNLLANGKVVRTTILKDGVWTDIFKNVNVFDEYDKEIKYTVEEDRTDGQIVKVLGNAIDGFIITSTIIVPDSNKTDIYVKKIWEGEKQNKAVINLMPGNEKIDSVTLNSKNNWRHIFEDVNLTDKNGKEIIYDITEDEIEGYEVDVTGGVEKGFIVTNTEKDPIKKTSKRDIDVKKVWDGEKKKRTEIDLILNNKVVDSIVLNEANKWKHTFEDLDEFDAKGKELKYTIGEVEIDGYDVKITGNMDRGFTVTNTEDGRDIKRDIYVRKTWIGEALDEATVKLFADGKEVDKVKLNEKNKFRYTFEDMPSFKTVREKDRNGKYYDKEKEIEYTIGEVEAKGYKVDIDGDMEDGFKITNTLIDGPAPLPVEMWNIPVNIKWIGGAPTLTQSVTMLGDGEVVSTAILSNENNWSHTFKDLPSAKSETAVEFIIYHLQDVIIPGYSVVIEGDMTMGYTIIATQNGYADDSKYDHGGDILLDDEFDDEDYDEDAGKPSFLKDKDNEDNYVEDVKTNDTGVLSFIALATLAGAAFLVISKKKKSL